MNKVLAVHFPSYNEKIFSWLFRFLQKVFSELSIFCLKINWQWSVHVASRNEQIMACLFRVLQWADWVLQ